MTIFNGSRNVRATASYASVQRVQQLTPSDNKACSDRRLLQLFAARHMVMGYGLFISGSPYFSNNADSSSAGIVAAHRTLADRP